MPFAPHEIENKKFVVALRGYQPDDVDAFLRAVAADYRALLENADDASPGRLVTDIERIMTSAREEAEREAAELRAAAAADAAAMREAAELETEKCLAEIARQAEELRRLETALWARMHALEHIVNEAKHTLAHSASLYPMGDENLGVDTNVDDAIAAR